MDFLAKRFNEYFSLIPASSEEDIKQALRVRYQVYCLETKFEDSKDHIEQLERDEFDDRSVHTLLMHKKSGLIAGTVRLVLPDPNCPTAPFPIEKYCGDAFHDNEKYQLSKFPREHLAEASRFCISRDFKKRLGEQNSLWGTDIIYESDARRVLPHITVGLVAAAVRMSARHDIRYWYAVMEPPLIRLLTRFGVHFKPIGELVEYHGVRRPCFVEVADVVNHMQSDCPEIWNLVCLEEEGWPLYRVAGL